MARHPFHRVVLDKPHEPVAREAHVVVRLVRDERSLLLRLCEAALGEVVFPGLEPFRIGRELCEFRVVAAMDHTSCASSRVVLTIHNIKEAIGLFAVELQRSVEKMPVLLDVVVEPMCHGR
jgi:hypothetical protein